MSPTPPGMRPLTGVLTLTGVLAFTGVLTPPGMRPLTGVLTLTGVLAFTGVLTPPGMLIRTLMQQRRDCGCGRRIEEQCERSWCACGESGVSLGQLAHEARHVGLGCD